MKEIRIGVVGTGHLGSYHLQKYQQIPECRIVGVADAVEERARKAAELYGCEVLDGLPQACREWSTPSRSPCRPAPIMRSPRSF